MSEDGVPESHNSGKSINVLTVRLINCALVVPLAIVKSYNETKVDVDVIWKPLIRQINVMKDIRVHHMCFDAVKRKEVLGMKGHAGYYSCPYCDIKGVYLAGKVVFPHKDAIKANLRTDAEIREIMNNIDKLEDPDDRKGILSKSPLTELDNFSFVEQVGLDYLHNYCLGKFNAYMSQVLKIQRTFFIVTRLLINGHKFNLQEFCFFQVLYETCLIKHWPSKTITIRSMANQGEELP